jgi:hypothetical protein
VEFEKVGIPSGRLSGLEMSLLAPGPLTMLPMVSTA